MEEKPFYKDFIYKNEILLKSLRSIFSVGIYSRTAY